MDLKHTAVLQKKYVIKFMHQRPYILLVLIMFFVLSSIGFARSATNYKDGKHIGRSKLVDVCVTIENGKIEKIDVIEHRGGGNTYLEVLGPLTKQMVSTQSTEVDVITGATASSKDLIEAVNDAIRKASEN